MGQEGAQSHGFQCSYLCPDYNLGTAFQYRKICWCSDDRDDVIKGRLPQEMVVRTVSSTLQASGNHGAFLAHGISSAPGMALTGKLSLARRSKGSLKYDCLPRLCTQSLSELAHPSLI